MTRYALLCLAAVLVAGCSGGEPAPHSPAPSSSTSPAADAASSARFDEEHYRYTLRQSCFCLPSGRVRLEVRDGVVVAAGYVGREAGRVPGSLRLTVQDLLARAAGDVDRATVDWAAGSPAPSRISIDHDTNMSDDEVRWSITGFRVLDPVPSPIID